ncbi:MAG TPA: ThiF family adenylyltransferase [Casimicrobiaceae bacterium]
MSDGIRITGAIRLYAIIGDPIAQVRSPETITEGFAARGMNAMCIPAHVPVDRFDAIVPALLALGNLDGVLVTVPFKTRMLGFADRLGKAAKTIGAVNALRRETDGSWSADMFDGMGFVRGVERKGEKVRGRRVALFGAGGAGSAIAYALADAGAQSIAIIDPDAGRAAALVDKLKAAVPGCAVATAKTLPRDADMVVNASPVGMRADDGMPGEIPNLDAGTLVGDVVIAAQPTALIRHATACGCRWVDGRDMHAGQVDAIVSFFASASRSHND